MKYVLIMQIFLVGSCNRNVCYSNIARFCYGAIARFISNLIVQTIGSGAANKIHEKYMNW